MFSNLVRELGRVAAQDEQVLCLFSDRIELNDSLVKLGSSREPEPG